MRLQFQIRLIEHEVRFVEETDTREIITSRSKTFTDGIPVDEVGTTAEENLCLQSCSHLVNNRLETYFPIIKVINTGFNYQFSLSPVELRD